MDCIFCKIISKDIPCSKLYEDKDIIAFMDIGPVNKGHALVLPKKHYETIIDAPDDVFAKLMPVIKKVAKAVKEGTNADGINILQNNFKASGQIVPHLHFHIIPRFENDGFKHWPQGKYSGSEIEEYRARIAKLL